MTSTIYRHWPTRTEMVAAAFAELIPPLAAPDLTEDLSHQLESILSPLAEQVATEQFAALVPSLLAGAARDPDLAPFHAEFVSRQREPVRTVLRQAVQDGALRPLDLDEAISQLVGPLLFQRVILDEPMTQDFTVARPRKVHPDGIHLFGLRYLDTTVLGEYVGEPVTIRYDPRDVAEIRVFHEGRFLCRAISPELAAQTIGIKEITAARNARRRGLTRGLTHRATVVDRLLAVHQQPPPPPAPARQPARPAAPALKLYREE